MSARSTRGRRSVLADPGCQAPREFLRTHPTGAVLECFRARGAQPVARIIRDMVREAETLVGERLKRIAAG